MIRIVRDDRDDLLRPGITIHLKPKPLAVYLAIPLSLGPRPHQAWFGFSTLGGFKYSLDFLRDHVMRRGHDVDSWTWLECRRCGCIVGQGEKVGAYCSGFNIYRREMQPIFVIDKYVNGELVESPKTNVGRPLVLWLLERRRKRFVA